MFLSHYQIRSPRLADLDRCFEIETIAYEGDEAATREKIKTRIEQYPDGFMVLEFNNVVAGFINSGCADEVHMSDEHFKELIGHHSEGKHNVIMSVVVHPEHQGLGIAQILMVNYIQRMKRLKKSSIQLMCKDRHIGFYEQFGFQYVRPSSSDHGGMAWHEMRLPLARDD